MNKNGLREESHLNYASIGLFVIGLALCAMIIAMVSLILI